MSAHKALKALQRGIRVRTDAARRALANVNPKAIERSTVIGISLFAASSIALQGFVVAQGNLSGRSAGVAQAAVVPHLNSIAPAAVATGRAELDPAELQPLKRGDRLELGAAGWQDDVRMPRVAAGTVAADTVLTKSVSAAEVGLRVATFGPELKVGHARGSVELRPQTTGGEVAMTSRLQSGAEPSSTPKPTRVAFLSAPASELGRQVMKDTARIIDVAPPSRSARVGMRSQRRVPKAIVEKVHFQDHPDRCLPNDLLDVIYDVAERYGEVQILSTFRDRERNRRVGGAPRSFHLRCQAIDFRVIGRSNGLLEYLEKRADVGGLKRYPLGFFHIDNGPRRTW
ncbi:MAG: DUF882 domain-containing protein [Hyphomicrobiaceae bacterium]|nr:DUF882 domain-containing protein [Hyphomicrobiaceae bacterium]